MGVDMRPPGARQADHEGARVRIAGTLRGLSPGALPPDVAARIAVSEGATDGGKAAYIASARARLARLTEKSRRLAEMRKAREAAEHRLRVSKAEAAGIGGWGRR